MISATELNRVMDEVERSSRMTVEYPLELINQSGGMNLRLVDPEIWAKITDSDSGQYGWEEWEAIAGATFQKRPGGKSGTTDQDFAYEINGATVATGTIVKLAPGFTGEWVFVVSGGLVEIAVTSSTPDGSGYYSGTADGNAVKVKNVNGYPLDSGKNVLGTPNGLDGSTPAYLTDMGGYSGTTARTWVSSVSCSGGTLTVNYSTETIVYVNGVVISTTVS
jgi:hypothetical protein